MGFAHDPQSNSAVRLMLLIFPSELRFAPRCLIGSVAPPASQIAAVRFAAALSSFYHPVKVAPLRCALLTSDAIPRVRASRERIAPKVELYQPISKTSMSYIEQFEAELVKKLQSGEAAESIVRWVSEQVLKSYRNGIAAGQKGAQVIRKGASRRPALPPQSL